MLSIDIHGIHDQRKFLDCKNCRRKLRSENVAIVIGKTIHLHRVSKKDFLKDEKWVKHEMCHLEQFKKYGFLNFIFKYLLESIKVGYYNNKFEAEARNAENE